jgi:hypothetical protein
VDLVQAMMDSVRAGEWDGDHRKVQPLLRASWLVPRGDRRLIQLVIEKAESLEGEQEAGEKERKRVALVEALRDVQRRTAKKIL